MSGTWEDKYVKKRKNKKRLYRLQKRVAEISSVIKKNFPRERCKLLEIGSGDGLFLSELHKKFPGCEFSGAEPVKNLMDLNEDGSVKLFLASSENLPFDNSFFDVVVMPASIEHIENTDGTLKEINRVLKAQGLVIITWPNPFWDKINGLFVDTGHCRRFTFSAMRRLLSERQFDIIKQYGFMLFPFFNFSFYGFLERIFRVFKLDFLLFNYLVAAKRR